MNKLLPFQGFTPLMLLALLALVLAGSQSLQAAPAPSAPAGPALLSAAPQAGLLLAADDGWSFRHLLRGLDNRSRVVQVCVIVMCLALLILMKK